MNYIDVILIIIAIIGLLIGWKLRGVLTIVIPIAFLVGIFIANYGYHSMAEVLIKYIPTESKRFLISYVIIFLIASCVIIFVGVLLSRFFDFFNLAFIDRIFGAALMITLLLIPVYFLFMKMEGIAKFNFTQDVNKSFLFPYVKNYIEFILRIPVLKHLDMVGKILK
ncbi:MAG: CvpA family protein [bacterium]